MPSCVYFLYASAVIALLQPAADFVLNSFFTANLLQHFCCKLKKHILHDVSLKRFDLTSCILSMKLGNFHCWPMLGIERLNAPALHDLKQM